MIINSMNLNKLNELKKGQEFIFSYGCYDNYRGFLEKKLKYKLVVNVLEKNGRIQVMERLDFNMEYVRSVGEYTSPNPTPESIIRSDTDHTFVAPRGV